MVFLNINNLKHINTYPDLDLDLYWDLNLAADLELGQDSYPDLYLPQWDLATNPYPQSGITCIKLASRISDLVLA